MPELDYDIPPQCPGCLKFLTGYTAADNDPEAKPEPGDLTICIGCALPLIFTDDLQVRKVGKGELDEKQMLEFMRSLGKLPDIKVIIDALKKRDGEDAVPPSVNAIVIGVDIHGRVCLDFHKKIKRLALSPKHVVDLAQTMIEAAEHSLKYHKDT